MQPRSLLQVLPPFQEPFPPLLPLPLLSSLQAQALPLLPSLQEQIQPLLRIPLPSLQAQTQPLLLQPLFPEQALPLALRSPPVQTLPLLPAQKPPVLRLLQHSPQLGPVLPPRLFLYQCLPLSHFLSQAPRRSGKRSSRPQVTVQVFFSS